MRFIFVLYFSYFLALTSGEVMADVLTSAAKPLLLDTDFLLGYEVMSPQRDIYTDRSSAEVIHTEQPGKQQPVWRLVQWGSGNSIAKASPLVLPGGGTSWIIKTNSSNNSATYKRISTGVPTRLPDQKSVRSLVLELNGLAEFSSDYYVEKNSVKNKRSHYLSGSDEYWPHLLMVQNLKSEKLSNYQSLNLSMDARLLFDKKNIREGYQRDRHAARFVISIAVRNTMTNNSFWLNMVVYDDRYPSSGFLCQKCHDNAQTDCYTPDQLGTPGVWSCPFDGERWSKESDKKGTRRMLFRLPTAAATSANIQDGDWVGYRVDLFPYIKAGIEAARADKTLRGFPESLELYDLTLFSMGWEITGLNHSAIQIRQISLNAH